MREPIFRTEQFIVFVKLVILWGRLNFTNNDLDSIGYLFWLPFLLYYMTLTFLYVRRLIKHYYYYIITNIVIK